MNDIQIFNNPDFGEIRTIMIDDEPWFVAKDISDKLGYAKPANMVKLVDGDDKSTISSSILEPEVKKQAYNISIVNESGLYAAIFGSKQENAKKFKKWVTSEVLPSLRKTGSYSTQKQLPMSTDEKIQLIAQGYTEVREEIKSVRDDLEALKMDLPILPIEADRITEAVRKRGVACLGGKQSSAYQNRGLRQKLYNNLYANLKYNFGCKSYKSIKRSQTDRAIEIIQRYEPPFFLQQTIENENAQERLDI
ncbi:MAG: ORF6C domain-containing protein [Clostridiales bacterium]|nr:ORF6C domain-containing protein [Clostridiales bacterium]